MKKMLFCIFSLISCYAYSQVKLGILAGGVRSTIREPDVTRQVNTFNTNNQFTGSVINNYVISGTYNYFGGIVLNAPLGKNTAFRPQINYILKGEEFTLNRATRNSANQITGSTSIPKNKIEAQYIEVPINFVFNASTKGGRFFIGAGPYAAYALSANYIDPDGEKTAMSFDLNDVDSLTTANQFDYGVNVTTGYEFKGGLFLNFNFSRGLRDFETTYGLSSKHQVLSFGIGFMFH